MARAVLAIIGFAFAWGCISEPIPSDAGNVPDATPPADGGTTLPDAAPPDAAPPDAGSSDAEAALRAELVTRIAGPVLAAAIENDRAYVGIGSRLALVDVADPRALTVLAYSEPLEEPVRDIAVSGADVFVALGWGGAVVLERTPDDELILREDPFGLEEDAFVRRVEVAGPYLLVSDRDRLHVYEVTGIRHRGTYLAPGRIGPFAATPDAVYMVTSASIQIWDLISLTDPDAPVLLGSTEVDGGIEAIATSTGHVYVGTNRGIIVYRMMAPGMPVVLGMFPRVSLDPGSDAIQIVDDVAYVQPINSGVRRYGVSDPSAPQALEPDPVHGDIRGFSTDGRILLYWGHVDVLSAVALPTGFSHRVPGVAGGSYKLLLTDDQLILRRARGTFVHEADPIPGPWPSAELELGAPNEVLEGLVVTPNGNDLSVRDPHQSLDEIPSAGQTEVLDSIQSIASNRTGALTFAAHSSNPYIVTKWEISRSSGAIYRGLVGTMDGERPNMAVGPGALYVVQTSSTGGPMGQIAAYDLDSLDLTAPLGRLEVSLPRSTEAHVQGDDLVIGSDTLLVVDVSDPSAMAVRASVPDSVLLTATGILLACRSDEFRFYDLAVSVDRPVATQMVPYGPGACGPGFERDGYLFLDTYYRGLSVYRLVDDR